MQQVPSNSMNEDQGKGPSLSPKDLQLSPAVASGTSELSSTIASDKDTDAVDNATLTDELPLAKRPRSLRVSLTLPPSVETSPKPSSRSTSPKSTELPSWSLFSNNTLDVGYPVRTSTSLTASPPLPQSYAGNAVENAAAEATAKGSAVAMNDSKGSLQDDVFEVEHPLGVETGNQPVPLVPLASPPPKYAGSWSQPCHGAGPVVTLQPDTHPISSISKTSFDAGPPQKPPTEPAAASEVKELASTPTSVKAQVIQASSPVRSAVQPGTSHKVGVLQAPAAGRREVFLPSKANVAAVPLSVKPTPTIPSSSSAVAAKTALHAYSTSPSNSATSHLPSGADRAQQMQKQGSSVQVLGSQTHPITKPGQEHASHPPSGTRSVRTASAPVYQPPVHSGEQPSNPPPLGSQLTGPFRKDIIMATRPKRILHSKTVVSVSWYMYKDIYSR